MKNVYLCVDLVARTQEKPMKVGEGRKGMLIMTDEYERFEFDEVIPQVRKRNMMVYQGKCINISKTKDGRYTVNLHRLELSEIEPHELAIEIFKELEHARQELGFSQLR